MQACIAGPGTHRAYDSSAVLRRKRLCRMWIDLPQCDRSSTRLSMIIHAVSPQPPRMDQARVAMTFNLYKKYVALMSAGTMALAAYGTFATRGVHWMWNFGGVEYMVFWGIASLALAVLGWKEELAANRRLTTQPALAAV